MTDITAVRFADPWAFALLALVVAGIGVALLRARRPAAGLLFSSLGLLPAGRAGLRVRLHWLLVPLRVLALALFVVALARPQIVHRRFARGRRGAWERGYARAARPT